MNRRSFLALLASGLVGTAVDVDRLLWVPGEKTIFLPPTPGWSNTLVTPEWVMREVLVRLRNNLNFAHSISRNYDVPLLDGSMVTVRLPVRYQVEAR